ncbi:hypothetical protein SARC_08613 [Sphaeroforma arctica JP610]|uniref:CCR4-NOT transcription complex subunit 1 n=1 Tax=Sphaeroforma arctica JP610 TaxID=667725 RepID=A0A0L0FQJ6_9EUKA|nr:hypothetical protein SARC_08613 [Sphaeroforma arctica JP610]KNC78974.1 hypothetical protein SARC_08613 [Sphaeroforma arctica JP610]|eukprot:XP_014152876.1 hypothetical protein SARC_08613 [Sphaeroforma arctica JP610]
MGVLQRAVSTLVISGEQCAAQPTFVERMLDRLQVLPLERCVLAACLITSEHAHICHQGKEAFSHAWRAVHKSSEDDKGEGQGVDLCAVGVVLNLLHWAPESHRDAVRDRMVTESARESRIYAHNSIILADPSVNALLLLPDDDVPPSMQTLAGGPGLEMDIVPDADAPTPDVTSISLVTIAGLMEEISYGCLQTREVWREVLQTLPHGAINGYSLAKAVSMMSCTQSNLEDSLLLQTSLEQTGPQLFLQNSNSANATPDPTTWDIQIFVDGIREVKPDLDWRDVVKGFDQPGVDFPNEQSVEFVVRLYRYATNGHNLPVETLVSPWFNNVPGQIAFLRLVVSNQNHCGVSLHSENSRYISDEGLMSPISEGPNRVWANVEVMECLLALAHSGYYNDVKELFSIPLKQCPDVLIFALVEAYPEWDTMQLDMCLRLLPVILANFPQTETLVLRLWKLREDMVLSAIADWYRREPNFIGRIVDIGNHLRALPTILDALPPRVAVDVGLKALGATHLQTWISERLKNPANQNAAIIFGQVLVRNILSRLSNATIAPKEVPPPETCRLVIDALTSAGTSPQAINEVHAACINVFPHHFQSQDPQQQQRQYMQKPSGMPPTTSLASVAATAVPFVPSPASNLSSGGNKVPQMNNNQQQLQQQQQQQQQHPQLQQGAPGGGRHLSQPAQTAASRQLAAAAQQAATDTQPIQPSQVSFSTDIEEEATSYFEKIYTGAMSITDLLNLLRNFNASPDRREQKVFDCMVHNLFDEYKFFHKYPDKELTMTSVVFGSLIQNHLLGFGACVIALRYILDALRQPPQTNMFKFGFCSLEQFQMRLHDWPHYCHAIAEIPHVRRVPELYAQVEKYASLPSPNPQSQNTGTGKSFDASPHLAATASPGVGGSGFGLTTNINTLLVASSGQGIAAPAQTVQEKVHFIFNNLSEINLTEKGEELMKWLHLDFFKWLSEYIVVKRASIEPNFHKLYLSFVQHIAVPDLLPMVRSSSISNIKILLGSEKISNSSSERSLLKNIGSWLGLITIGLDSPILLRDLPMKDLIVEGYHRRRLIFILPFIAKVLEAVKHSAVFSPPNPWTMGILRLLCELHRLPALKLNLKFEIEVLYKNIAVDLDAIEPSDLLTPQPMDEAQLVPTTATALLLPRQHAQHQQQQQQKNTDSTKGMGKIDASNWQVPQMGVNNTNNNSANNNNNTSSTIPAPPIGAGAQVVPGAQGAVTDTPMTNMHLQVQLNSQCAYFVQLPQLSRRCIQMSIDQSIKEMGGVLERSVYYCCTASRELVLKDFAMDGDENRMRHAAQVMAQSLSINLALVTCKDPLRATLANHLRTNFQHALQQANLIGSLSMEQQTIMVEQAVRFAVVENLELALSAIEKVAAGKTVAQIDESLQQAYAARRNHHDHHPNTPFYDIGYINNNNRYPAYLPDLLRATPPGLRHHQYHVYEEFSKFGGDNKSRQGSLTGNVSPPSGIGAAYPTGSSNEPQSHENLSKPLLDPQSGESQVSQTSNAGNMLGLEKLMLVMAEIYKVINAAESAGAKCLADIPVSSNLFAFIRQASMVVMQDAKRAELALAVTYKITPPLFAIDADKDNQIYKDVHVLLLQSLCDISKAVPRAVTSFYLGQLSLEVKLSPENVQTVAKLIRVRLLIDADMDSELASYITENVNTSNDTANSKNNDTVADIMTALHSDKSLPASYTDISPAKMLRVAAALDRPRTVVQSDSVKDALEALREGYNRSESDSAHYMVSPETIVSIELLLDQCVRLGFHSQPLHTDMLYAHLVTLLQQQRMLKSDESAAMFIRLSVAVAVKATLKAPFRDVSDEEEERTVVSPTAADAANAGSMPLNSLTGTASPTATASVASKESSGPTERYMNYMALDAVSKLFFILIKMAGGDPNTNAAAQKQLSLLNTALEVVVVAVLNDVGEGAAPRPGSTGTKSDGDSKAIGSGRGGSKDKSELYQRVYFRLIANLFRDLTQTDSLLDHIHPQILNGLASTLHLLQPARIPRFAFAWLKLIAHRSFMPKLLLLKGQKGWPLYQKLLVELLVFMAPALKSCNMTAPMRVLYQGLLRILLILLHDFPELLCNYHFAFCDAIPASCIQVRNLILSAFPKNMRLPDPFTPNLKVDLLPEINQSPNLYGDYLAALEKNDFRRHLDQYLKTREVSFLMNLSQSVLLQSQAEIDAYGTKYDVPLINALVLYVGVQAIVQLQKTQGTSPITRSGPMDVFQQLIMDLDTEGRYFCLNAIANQLRYPNNHTHYFSCVLLFLFAEAQQEVIQEQITRVLVERLIVHRPHPWGLLITFIELIKNPRYRFWSHSFVYCASEIKDLFDSVRESVARSCMYTQKPPTEGKEVTA